MEEEKNKSSFIELTNFSPVTGNAGGFAFCHGGTKLRVLVKPIFLLI